MYSGKKCRILIIVVLTCIFFSGCGGDSDKGSGDITGSNPTIEEREDMPKKKEEVIDEAMAVAGKVKEDVESIDKVENAEVYINHESVLVALKLKQSFDEVDDELRQRIEDMVYENYNKAKTIAVSNDEDAYESVGRLVKYFEENDNTKLFFKDMKEIIDKIFKKDGSES